MNGGFLCGKSQNVEIREISTNKILFLNCSQTLFLDRQFFSSWVSAAEIHTDSNACRQVQPCLSPANVLLCHVFSPQAYFTFYYLFHFLASFQI